VPACPGTPEAREPGTSSAGSAAVCLPSRSAAWPQPEPSTRAMSCRGTPVRSAMVAAAARAWSKGFTVSAVSEVISPNLPRCLQLGAKTGTMAPVTTTPSTPVEKYPSGSAVGQSSTRAGSRVVIIGGGPGGYEAALVAAQLGADVTLVETKWVGGSADLPEVVPSKTRIDTAEWMTLTESAVDLGIRPRGESEASDEADFATVDARVLRLAKAQSRDIHACLE